MARQLTCGQVEAKRVRERAVVREMIGAFCHGTHGSARGTLCPACAELAAYADQRVVRCPHTATKTFCSRCETPCYAPAMRQRIRAVMRYAGPRMLLTHPLMTIRHGVDTLAARRFARTRKR